MATTAREEVMKYLEAHRGEVRLVGRNSKNRAAKTPEFKESKLEFELTCSKSGVVRSLCICAKCSALSQKLAVKKAVVDSQNAKRDARARRKSEIALLKQQKIDARKTTGKGSAGAKKKINNPKSRYTSVSSSSTSSSSSSPSST